jgi:hypothetical protein
MKIEFDTIKQCYSFWAWVYYEWNYLCGKNGKREKGVRIFGITFRNGKCTCK